MAKIQAGRAAVALATCHQHMARSVSPSTTSCVTSLPACPPQPRLTAPRWERELASVFLAWGVSVWEFATTSLTPSACTGFRGLAWRLRCEESR